MWEPWRRPALAQWAGLQALADFVTCLAGIEPLISIERDIEVVTRIGGTGGRAIRRDPSLQCQAHNGFSGSRFMLGSVGDSPPQRSSGFRPVCFAMRASIRGPSSLRHRLTMFKAVGESTEGQSLHPGDGICGGDPVGQDARKSRDFSEPAAVGLLLLLDGERHGRGSLLPAVGRRFPEIYLCEDADPRLMDAFGSLVLCIASDLSCRRCRRSRSTIWVAPLNRGRGQNSLRSRSARASPNPSTGVKRTPSLSPDMGPP